MTRMIFKSKSSRKDFFLKLLKLSSSKNWKTLYENNKINRSVWSDYRSGRLSIPQEIYQRFLVYFNKRDIEYFSKKINVMEDNWGKIKGGKKTYFRHKILFNEGRKKGLIALSKIRKNSDFDFTQIELDRELSYFIGLLIGDGFVNKYNSSYLIQFIGHKKELEYYRDIICEYVKSKFNLNPIIKESNEGNFIRVNIYSKSLFNLLTKEFDIPPGRKSHIVLIPPKILNSEKEIIFSLLAGIYDAEGCVFIDKREKYSKPYPRIDLHMINQKILNQIKEIFDREGINCSFANISNDNSRILIYGEKNIKNFLEKIPIKNPKHLLKIKDFLK